MPTTLEKTGLLAALQNTGAKLFVRNTWIGGNVNTPGYRLNQIGDDYLARTGINSYQTLFGNTVSNNVIDCKYINNNYIAVTTSLTSNTTLLTNSVCYSPDGLQWTAVTTKNTGGITTSTKFTSVAYVPNNTTADVWFLSDTYYGYLSSSTLSSNTATVASYIGVGGYFSVVVGTDIFHFSNATTNSLYKFSTTAKTNTTYAIGETLLYNINGAVAYNNNSVIFIGSTSDTQNSIVYKVTNLSGTPTFTLSKVYFNNTTIDLVKQNNANNTFFPVGITVTSDNVICLAVIERTGSSPLTGISNNYSKTEKVSFYTSTDGGSTFNYKGCWCSNIPLSTSFISSNTAQGSLNSISVSTVPNFSTASAASITNTKSNNTFASNGKTMALGVIVYYDFMISSTIITYPCLAFLKSNDSGITWDLTNYREYEAINFSGAQSLSVSIVSSCPNGFIAFYKCSGTANNISNRYVLTDPNSKELCLSVS